MNKSTIRILPCTFQEMQSSCLLHLEREISKQTARSAPLGLTFRYGLAAAKARWADPVWERPHPSLRGRSGKRDWSTNRLQRISRKFKQAGGKHPQGCFH